jgi:DNA processing protein
MENELLYRMALTRVPGIGPMRTKILIRHFGQASAVFRAGGGTLEKIRWIGEARARAIKEFREFQAAEKELVFVEKYKIQALFFTDPAYPTRLLRHRNAPALLFYKGTADLNAPKILAVVGTRAPTEYGRQITERLIGSLAIPDLLIVSGLAYGIDAVAHKSALCHGLPTIGVLGHGLDRIYPQQHAGLARSMIKAGGLLTGFVTGTEPEEHNFPIRNRIIAALCDALIVVETGARGGSTLTVDDAIACKRKVFALPGRITDNKSSGCNALIHQGKARLLTGAQQLLQEMQWGEPPASASDKPSTAGNPTISGKPSTAGKPEEFSFPPRLYSLPLRPVPRHDPRSEGRFSRGSGSPRPAKRTIPAKGSAYLPPLQAAWALSETQLSALGLSKEEKFLLDLLRETGGLSLDQLLTRDDLGGNQVSLTLLTLELHGLLNCMPGKKYIPI